MKKATNFIITALVAMLLIGGCTYFNKKFGLPNDHIGEELLEEIIEGYLDSDIDLTP